MSRLGYIAISISTAAGPCDQGVGARDGLSARTITTGGMTITGPSRAGTG